MRILIVHNHYREPGGEDTVFRAERDLLRAAGHEVLTLSASNTKIERAGFRTAIGAIWNRKAVKWLQEVCGSFQPDVVHFHNTMPLLSPWALRAARKTGAAVVQTLHNYRYGCPTGLLYRAGSVCEDCTGRKFPWQGVARGCYRGSQLATAVVGATQTVHRWVGTWQDHVDRYIALTDFARDRFVEWGLPESKVTVKSNFVGARPQAPGLRSGALFVGRLSAEKGILYLLRAARWLGDRYPIRVVGDGPLSAEVEALAAELPNFQWLGRCGREQVQEEMDRAACLVFPSTWYEGMPMTILEAFASGLPVIASNCGAIPSVVRDGENGHLVAPASSLLLGRAIDEMLSSPAMRERLGRGALESFNTRFTPEQNLRELEALYSEACAERHAGELVGAAS